MARFFRRAPFAEPGSARGFTEMFDWSALDRVLQPPLAEPAERAQAANVIVVGTSAKGSGQATVTVQ